MQESFFDSMYKDWFLSSISIWICQIFCLRYVIYKNIFFLVQRELLVTTNITLKLYYEEVPNEKLKSPSKLKAFMDKVMDQV